MEGDYLKLSQFLYNFHQFPYNSYSSPLGTIEFLTERECEIRKQGGRGFTFNPRWASDLPGNLDHTLHNQKTDPPLANTTDPTLLHH